MGEDEIAEKLIRNGKIVTSEKTFAADIYIKDGKIAAIGEGLYGDCETIDARGRYILPGGVDVHTHLNLQLGDRKVSDGFYAGTRAAAFGGTTTIVDHPEAGPAGCSLHHKVDHYKDMLSKTACIDYSVHGVFQHVDEKILSEIPELTSEGVTSIKAYMTYDNMLSGSEVEKILTVMGKNGGLTAFHAEDDKAIKTLRETFGSEGKLTAVYHPLSRPDTAEADSIRQILDIAEKAGNIPVYIVHLSTKKGLDVIREAQAKGQRVVAETCPQYLLLDDGLYAEPDGLKYVMAPPLRKKSDCEALWQGLADGSISTVGTDHCSFSYADKLRYGSADFRLCPGGAPGVETRLPLLYSEGVVKNRISINKFVEITAENPAKVMGLYPKKGKIEKGADADLVIWNEKTKTMSQHTLHQKCDYTPYEGMQVTGWPSMTLLRGETIVDSRGFHGKRGSGQFIERRKYTWEKI